jgi:ATP-dependent Clp protease ATP-binding subunit ClpA
MREMLGMLERFTERARRTIFFARYEASQLGGVRMIEPEHLLLGLLRADSGLLEWLLPADDFPSLPEALRRRSMKDGPSPPTSVEMPLSELAKQAFALAAEEADRFPHKNIDTAHILLGILRVEEGPAPAILRDHGLSLRETRERIASIPMALRATDFGRRRKLVPDEETAKRIAEAVWIPVFGRERVEGQKPFRVSFEIDAWHVCGTVPNGTDQRVLAAMISQWNAEILFIEPSE